MSLPGGFTYIEDVDSSILPLIRYATTENFVGAIIDGYLAPRAILTCKAAIALQKAQEIFLHKGYSIVVYDAYRPQKAVDHFIRWSSVVCTDDVLKTRYYPALTRSQAFSFGYIATKSAHSRGSTVDISLIEKHEKLLSSAMWRSTGIQSNDDGTVNMGSHFDFLDERSHFDCPFISESCRSLRQFLRSTMSACGFRPYDQEWWHFTLIDEPYPDTFF